MESWANPSACGVQSRLAGGVRLGWPRIWGTSADLGTGGRGRRRIGGRIGAAPFCGITRRVLRAPFFFMFAFVGRPLVVLLDECGPAVSGACLCDDIGEEQAVAWAVVLWVVEDGVKKLRPEVGESTVSLVTVRGHEVRGCRLSGRSERVERKFSYDGRWPSHIGIARTSPTISPNSNSRGSSMFIVHPLRSSQSRWNQNGYVSVAPRPAVVIHYCLLGMAGAVQSSEVRIRVDVSVI
jgi:hypothetical protein